MIISGSSAPKATAQQALVIWDNCTKKKMEQALKKIDANAFAAVRYSNRLDIGTPDARHILKALPHDVATVQRLRTTLKATGLRVEFTDPTPPTNPAAFQSTKGRKKSGLAQQSQAGLSEAIAKAGNPTAPPHRVHGQCDYYSANLKHCPRGADCRFACYNGPAKP